MRRSWSSALVVSLSVLVLGCGEPPPPRTQLDPTPEPSATESPAPTTAASSSAAPTSAVPFEPKRVTFEQGAMGTKVTIVSYTTPEHDEDRVKRAILEGFAELQRLERLMSTWIADSEVSRINAAAGKDWVAVGPETFEVIEKSLWVGRESAGVFDISFEAMKGLWKFDEGAEAKIPAKPAIDEARKLIDYRQILVDGAERRVKLGKAGMRINLGGIAKGYAVDAVAKKLEAAGLRSYFVQAGGDLFVRGRKPDGSRFRVGIRDPRGKHEGDYFATIEVEDHAFSTAGDYERAFVKDGKRYHHIIDPRTGYPSSRSRSVTVWAKDAFTADAIDDALFILGAEEGMRLVDALDDAGAVVVGADNRVTISKRLEGLVSVARPPSEGI